MWSGSLGRSGYPREVSSKRAPSDSRLRPRLDGETLRRLVLTPAEILSAALKERSPIREAPVRPRSHNTPEARDGGERRGARTGDKDSDFVGLM